MNCYIAPQDRDYELPKHLDKDNTIFYPETGMTTFELHTSSVPKDFHIVTDSHFLAPLYKKEEVFIFKNGEWVNPDINTYGSSYDYILHHLWSIKISIPRAIYDGQVTNVVGRKFQPCTNAQ